MVYLDSRGQGQRHSPDWCRSGRYERSRRRGGGRGRGGEGDAILRFTDEESRADDVAASKDWWKFNLERLERSGSISGSLRARGSSRPDHVGVEV